MGLILSHASERVRAFYCFNHFRAFRVKRARSLLTSFERFNGLFRRRVRRVLSRRGFIKYLGRIGLFRFWLGNTVVSSLLLRVRTTRAVRTNVSSKSVGRPFRIVLQGTRRLLIPRLRRCVISGVFNGRAKGRLLHGTRRRQNVLHVGVPMLVCIREYVPRVYGCEGGVWLFVGGRFVCAQFVRFCQFSLSNSNVRALGCVISNDLSLSRPTILSLTSERSVHHVKDQRSDRTIDTVSNFGVVATRGGQGLFAFVSGNNQALILITHPVNVRRVSHAAIQVVPGHRAS